jgi:putative addiction module component (TIGR02574 family)
MSDRVKNLSLQARKLPLAERAELIEDLLASLDAPDGGIDALWAEEAERRVQLLDAGEMPTRDAAEVIAELRQRQHG